MLFRTWLTVLPLHRFIIEYWNQVNGSDDDGCSVCVVQVALNKPINVGLGPKSHRESYAMAVVENYCDGGAAIGSSKQEWLHNTWDDGGKTVSFMTFFFLSFRSVSNRHASVFEGVEKLSTWFECEWHSCVALHNRVCVRLALHWPFMGLLHYLRRYIYLDFI